MHQSCGEFTLAGNGRMQQLQLCAQLLADLEDATAGEEGDWDWAGRDVREASGRVKRRESRWKLCDTGGEAERRQACKVLTHLTELFAPVCGLEGRLSLQRVGLSLGYLEPRGVSSTSSEKQAGFALAPRKTILGPGAKYRIHLSHASIATISAMISDSQR